MPLGKYYCDYCDKQFQDTPSARKRHLQGLQHQRARALWYDTVSRPSPANHLPQSEKPICNSFVRTVLYDYTLSISFFGCLLIVCFIAIRLIWGNKFGFSERARTWGFLSIPFVSASMVVVVLQLITLFRFCFINFMLYDLDEEIRMRR